MRPPQFAGENPYIAGKNVSYSYGFNEAPAIRGGKPGSERLSSFRA